MKRTFIKQNVVITETFGIHGAVTDVEIKSWLLFTVIHVCIYIYIYIYIYI